MVFPCVNSRDMSNLTKCCLGLFAYYSQEALHGGRRSRFLLLSIASKPHPYCGNYASPRVRGTIRVRHACSGSPPGLEASGPCIWGLIPWGGGLGGGGAENVQRTTIYKYCFCFYIRLAFVRSIIF